MDERKVVSVLIGAFIMLIPFLSHLSILSPDTVTNYFDIVIRDSSAFLWMIGGLVTAFVAEKGIKGGIWVGFLAAFISNIIIFTLYSPVFGALTVFVIFFIIMVGLFGIIGGLMGGLLNRWRFETITRGKLILTFLFALYLFAVFLLFLIPSPTNDPSGGIFVFLAIIVPIIIIFILSTFPEEIINILTGYKI